jgi:hypothetical protein
LIALAVIWLGGIVMLSYLVFFFDRPQMPRTGFAAADFYDSENIQGDNNPSDLKTDSKNINDAYVFINVNEKHILTKFVSVLSEEELKSPANNTIRSSVKKINRIIKTVNARKQPDFSIKSAPEL